MPKADEDSVKLCLDGQPGAFSDLVQRYQGRLLSYLSGQLGDWQQAQDAAQEAFVRAYFALNKLSKPQSFFPWLTGIAKRVALEQERAERRQRPTDMKAFCKQPQTENEQDAPLKQAVSRLPEIYREVVLLRYYGGLSCAEAAEQLSVPIGTVTKRLSRAYGLLRESLQSSQAQRAASEVQR